MLPAPTHVPVAAPVVLINILLKVSLNAAPVSVVALVLVIVKSIWLVPPMAMVGVINVLLIVGAAAVTVSVAVLETAPVGASALATPVVVFGSAPGVLLVTRIVTVQLPNAGIVRPVMFKRPVWFAV